MARMFESSLVKLEGHSTSYSVGPAKTYAPVAKSVILSARNSGRGTSGGVIGSSVNNRTSPCGVPEVFAPLYSDERGHSASSSGASCWCMT
ncbi:hypothetical protein VTO73DRAFT_8951 [Trametes versicolor]